MPVEKHTAFDTSHPAVPCGYFALAVLIAMCSMQPVLIGISFTSAFSLCMCVRGARATLSGLRWQLPVLLVIAVFNPLFSASGSTELFRLGTRAVYAESLFYGACMGGLFVSTVLWFQAASAVLTFDKVMVLFGSAAPVVALMLSMCMRLVPRFVRKGGDIARCMRIVGRGGGLRGRLRMSTVLMGWSMEDSLETADSMRARGWGAVPRRTTYARYRFTGSDALALACIGALALLAAVCAAAAVSQYAFYPRMSRLVVWWGYLPYAALMLLPTALHALERLSWTRAEKRAPCSEVAARDVRAAVPRAPVAPSAQVEAAARRYVPTGSGKRLWDSEEGRV